MTISIKDVYQWHRENAEECIGRADQAGQARMHLDFAQALRPFLPPQLCASCRGSGFRQLNDSDACDIVPCDCQRS